MKQPSEDAMRRAKPKRGGRNEQAKLRDATAVVAEVQRLQWFIEAEGYRRCDVPACNCGSFHGGHANQRLHELFDTLDPANGQTALARAEELRAENARLIEDRARFPDRPDDIGCMIGAHVANERARRQAADAECIRLAGENATLRGMFAGELEDTP